MLSADSSGFGEKMFVCGFLLMFAGAALFWVSVLAQLVVLVPEIAYFTRALVSVGFVLVVVSLCLPVFYNSRFGS